MQQNNFRLPEWVLAVLIGLAILALVNPFHFLMPSALGLIIVMVLALLVIAFAVFVWREHPSDEREELHALKAARISFFVGGGVLLLAIIAQSINHSIDPWLLVALGSMVVAKLALSSWLQEK